MVQLLEGTPPPRRSAPGPSGWASPSASPAAVATASNDPTPTGPSPSNPTPIRQNLRSDATADDRPTAGSTPFQSLHPNTQIGRRAAPPFSFSSAAPHSPQVSTTVCPAILSHRYRRHRPVTPVTVFARAFRFLPTLPAVQRNGIILCGRENLQPQ